MALRPRAAKGAAGRSGHALGAGRSGADRLGNSGRLDNVNRLDVDRLDGDGGFDGHAQRRFDGLRRHRRTGQGWGGQGNGSDEQAQHQSGDWPGDMNPEQQGQNAAHINNF